MKDTSLGPHLPCRFLTSFSPFGLIEEAVKKKRSDCKVRTQEAENFDEEDKSLVKGLQAGKKVTKDDVLLTSVLSISVLPTAFLPIFPSF